MLDSRQFRNTGPAAGEPVISFSHMFHLKDVLFQKKPQSFHTILFYQKCKSFLLLSCHSESCSFLTYNVMIGSLHVIKALKRIPIDRES